ncbi:MAG: VOC family protein [Actinomycetia bacterium]|nr:VOC family protein [Actinomycetes bacterium]
MGAIGVNHISFTVSDLEQSIAFYTVLLEREPIERTTFADATDAAITGYDNVHMEAAFFELPGLPAVLELFEYHNPPGAQVDLENYNTGNAHIALYVDDIEREFERLSAAGATFRHPRPVLIEGGRFDGEKCAYLRDPNGITIELVQPPPQR